MLHDVGAWPDALVLGIGDPEDNYLSAKLRYKAFPQGIPGNLPLIVSSSPVIVERNASEVATVSESVQTNVNRNIGVSEPALSVLDVASRGVFVSRAPVESLGGVTDVPVARATRTIAIGEGPISVQDAILINLKKNVAVSETVLFSESVATQTTRVKAVTEASVSVSDAVSKSVRRSIALSEPNIVFSELVTHQFQRSIAASELILMSDSVSTTVNRNIEVLESITVFDSASINLIRSVVLTEIDIFVNDLATALALITTKTFDVDVSEPPIMFSDSVDVHDSKSIDILEDLGLISDSPIAEILRDGIVLQHRDLIVSLLQYFDSHSIVGLTRDRRIIAKANYRQIVGNGMVPLTVRIPDLKYIENILHVQFEVHPDPTTLFGPFWKKIDGNVVGMSIYQVTGVTVCTEVIAVGPP